MIARLGLLLSFILLSFGSAGPAAGHTDLVSSSPSAGAHLDTAPRSVTLDFSEQMSPELSAVSLDVAGENLSLRVRAGSSSTALVADVPPGVSSRPGVTTAWRVAYRVVSRDGHPVTGQLRFQVRGPLPSPSASTPPAVTATPAPAVPATEDAVAPAAESAGTPWLLIVGGGGVLLVLLTLAVAAGVRLARHGPVQ